MQPRKAPWEGHLGWILKMVGPGGRGDEVARVRDSWWDSSEAECIGVARAGVAGTLRKARGGPWGFGPHSDPGAVGVGRAGRACWGQFAQRWWRFWLAGPCGAIRPSSSRARPRAPKAQMEIYGDGERAPHPGLRLDGARRHHFPWKGGAEALNRSISCTESINHRACAGDRSPPRASRG